jgi:20S proteasome subunit beta 7
LIRKTKIKIIIKMNTYPNPFSEAINYQKMERMQQYDQQTLESFSNMSPMTRTQQPIVTGTSVLAVKFKDGIMMCTDCLASYGSLARFRNVERMIKVGDSTVIGASGDISDFQYITYLMDKLITKEYNANNGQPLAPENIYEYLSQVMYQRRNKFDPLWNALVVGGFKEGKSFLGYINLKGTTYQSETIATGYGAYIAQPLLRNAVEKKNGEPLTEEEAKKLLDDCMRVLFYRDARSLNKLQRATVTASGVTISEPYSLETEWSFAEHIRGYGA